MSCSEELKTKNGSEKRTLIIFRTHFLENCLINEVQKIKRALKPNEDCIIFFDNHKSKIVLDSLKQDIPLYEFEVNGEKISFLLFNEQELKKHNLPKFSKEKNTEDLSKTIHYNSDYPFYIVNHYLPQYDYYWQIEYDVYCNGKSYETFLNKFRNSSSDLIVPKYKHFTEEQGKNMFGFSNWIFDNKDKCISFFPVVRLSNKAIKFLYKKRLEHAEIYENIMDKPDVCWVFCEQFVSTELTKNGFVCENLEDEFLRFYPNYDLNTLRLFENPDNKLYHPVKPIINERPQMVVNNKIIIKGYY